MKTVVIGGGLAGVQSAYFLMKDGHQVTLLERNDELGAEASFANGGLLTPSHAAPWNSPGIFETLFSSLGKQDASIHVKVSAIGQYLGWGARFIRNSTRKRYFRTIERNFALARYSQNCFHQICADVPLKFFHARGGSMMIYRSMTSFNATKERFSELGRLGMQTRICTGPELVELEPALEASETSLVGGVYFGEDEHGDAHQFTQSLAGHVKQAGVNILSNTKVVGFERTGAKIGCVLTNAGRIEADAFIVAAGHWSTDLLRGLGISLPVRPVKGYSITYNLPDWKKGPNLPVVDDELHVAVTPMGNKVRLVGTAEFCGYDPEINPARIDLVRRSGLEIYPQLEAVIDGKEPELEWGGHRPMTPDCLPILGKCGFDNLYLNTGHGYLGWTTGSGTSQAVADLVAGRTPGLKMADYALNRF